MDERQLQFLIKVFRKARAFLEIQAYQQNEDHKLAVAERLKYALARDKDGRELADGKVSRLAAALEDTRELIKKADKEIDRLMTDQNLMDQTEPKERLIPPTRATEPVTSGPTQYAEIRSEVALEAAIAVDCNAGMKPGDISEKYGLSIGDTIETLRKLRRKGKVTWGRISR